MKEFGCAVRVYIEDTDAGGIVYYVNYLKYMERARTEFMRRLGYDKTFTFNTGCMFVVCSADVRYHKPARLDDELTATARIAESGAAQLVFEQRVWRGEDTLCGGRVRIACVDQHTLKPRRIPGNLLAALRQSESEERAE